MIDWPHQFNEASSPISTADLGTTGIEAAQKLAAQGYEVHIGLTPELADQILAMSRQPAIREYCPKDSSERFADRAATEHWLAGKGRAVFLLFKKTDDESLQLAGYGWSGPVSSSHAPGGETTFALRVGEVGHGQGLAAPFSWLIIAASAALYGARDFWLETWGSNGAAIHIYHKIGFETVDEEPGERLNTDGQKIADNRIYMLLPNNLLPS
jgi:GNAT superfamily N-acetyltransferase